MYSNGKLKDLAMLGPNRKEMSRVNMDEQSRAGDHKRASSLLLPCIIRVIYSLRTHGILMRMGEVYYTI
jgi:hypothetical protein